MINKYTSIKRVIAKVFADLALTEGDHRIPDMMEWASEAIEKIGAFPYFVVKTTGREGKSYLELDNYQTKLPMGAYNVLQVAYGTTSNGSFTPMKYATGMLDYNSNNPTEAEDGEYLFTDNELVILARDLYKYEDPNDVRYGQQLSYTDALAKINSESSTKELLRNLLLNKANAGTFYSGAASTPSSYNYVVNGGYIKTNVRTGYLLVTYQSIPLDVDGYPLIPDEPGYIEAVYWYITMKLKFPEWMEGRIRDAVYYRIENKWNFYCRQAYANAMMPNQDQMESIKNAWIRLIPNINAHRTGFSNIGEAEVIYNHNR